MFELQQCFSVCGGTFREVINGHSTTYTHTNTLSYSPHTCSHVPYTHIHIYPTHMFTYTLHTHVHHPLSPPPPPPICHITSFTYTPSGNTSSLGQSNPEVSRRLISKAACCRELPSSRDTYITLNARVNIPARRGQR